MCFSLVLFPLPLFIFVAVIIGIHPLDLVAILLLHPSNIIGATN
jgi:hypothetical protein